MIDEIAMPGTHNTMTYTTSLPWACCQIWTLEEQLTAGIRFLDIRCHHKKNEFHMYHTIDLGIMFSDVMRICKAFLKEHKTETILMRVRKEGEENCTRDFTDTFWTLHRDTELFAEINELTNLGKVRGKVVILRDFYDETRTQKPGEFGLNFRDSILQDDWEFVDITKKERAIKSHFEVASERRFRQLAINFFSCAGYRANQVYSKHYNELVWQINDPKCGILVFDFPSQRHILHVINLNNQTNFRGIRLAPESPETPLTATSSKSSKSVKHTRINPVIHDSAELIEAY